MTNTTGTRIIDNMDLYFINPKATEDNKQQVKDWKNLFNNFDRSDLFEDNRLQEIYYKLRDFSLNNYERALYEQEIKDILNSNSEEEARALLREQQEETKRQQEDLCDNAVNMVRVLLKSGKSLEYSINYLGLSGEIRQQVLEYFK